MDTDAAAAAALEGAGRGRWETWCRVTTHGSCCRILYPACHAGRRGTPQLGSAHRSVLLAQAHSRRPPPLLQVPALRPVEYSRISKRQKHVTRAYGGSRCGKCVRMRCAASPLHSPRDAQRWVSGALHGCQALHCAALPRRTSHCANGCPSCATVSSPPILTPQDCARLPDRGAEDRQEGAEDPGGGHQVGTLFSVVGNCV